MSKPTKRRLRGPALSIIAGSSETTVRTAGLHARIHLDPCSCHLPEKFPTIFTRIPGIERKAAQSDPERRFITLEHISANYPEDEWTQVSTDGSAIEATRDGDGGVYIKYRAVEEHISVAAGRYATNFRAEDMTLNTAAPEILASLDKTHKRVVFFSDALSVLDALQPPPPPQKKKKKKLNNLTSILS